MDHQEFTCKSHDGTTLYGQSWVPRNGFKAVIGYVHGFKDHSGRIEKWALQFTTRGYGVVAIDLRGHGRSDGRRGYAKKFSCLLKDVRVMCEYVRNNYPGITFVLYGHSLGGNIVANYLIAESLLPDAAIITSPWFTLAEKPPLMALAAAHVIRYVLPGLLVKSNLDAAMLSHEKQVARDYLDDPLVHNLILPRLFFEIESQGMKASQSIYKINVPLLVMHGTGDRITSCRHTRSFVRNAGIRTTYKEWPGYYHELHNDTGAQDVFNYTISWLDRLIHLHAGENPET
jgi:alpha-beta hydrolase superfamily lysophospholipase